MLPWVGDTICTKNMQTLFILHTFRVHNDVANTGVQSKQISDERFWRYNTCNKEEGMLSNFYNYIFALYKQLGCISDLANA